MYGWMDNNGQQQMTDPPSLPPSFARSLVFMISYVLTLDDGTLGAVLMLRALYLVDVSAAAAL